jgi:hypothetical protein
MMETTDPETIPNFENLGQSAKDIFTSGYHQGQGLIKVNVKTMSGKNFEMTSNTVLNFEASKVTKAVPFEIIADTRSYIRHFPWDRSHARRVRAL